ncbi:MAG: hypothetical protein NC541_06165 [bacterium]|nr:hypothetical protein [bacterium]
MEEREIDLVDLLADILSHWRGILISALAGAVLLGAFSYGKACFEAKKGNEGNQNAALQGGGTQSSGVQGIDDLSKEERLAELEKSLTEAEKAAVKILIDDEKENIMIRQYGETSVLMHMDPYSIPKLELIFQIQADDTEQGNILGFVYKDLFEGVGLFQWAEEQTGISAAVASELISAQVRSNEAASNGAQETGNCTLKVEIIHSDAAECERLAQCVKTYAGQQQKQLTQELGEHEIVLLSETSGVVTDMAVWDSQISYAERAVSFLFDCARARGVFSENQGAYYDLLKAEDAIQESAVQESDTADEPSVSMKYVILGAFLFAVVYAGVIFVRYLLNGRIRATDELQRLYRIPQLGLIAKEEEKKKFFVDRWIVALRSRNKRRFTGQKSLELAAAAVRISAKKYKQDTVFLIGCDLNAGAGAVCGELKERLAKENIRVRVLDNVLYDADAMQEFGDAKCVVLAEKAMSTTYDEIARELELISRQDTVILGGIIVE